MSLCTELIVNGKKIEIPAERRLLAVLREDLGLTSVKNGCAEGACGACTILVDGKPVRACVQPAAHFSGQSILTVEGLSAQEKALYVTAFSEAGAVQCGFCIPGMVLAAKALLDRNKTPSRAEAAAAIRNNICRCTGYKKILDGILLAASFLRDGLPAAKETVRTVIGQAMCRIDAAEKILFRA